MTERPEASEKPTTSIPWNDRSPAAPKRSGERFKTLNDFVDLTMQRLKPRQVAVWLCLFRDSRDGIATASQKYIAERCGLKRPTVSTTIGELEVLGLVITVHRGGINRGLSRYSVSGIVSTG